MTFTFFLLPFFTKKIDFFLIFSLRFISDEDDWNELLLQNFPDNYFNFFLFFFKDSEALSDFMSYRNGGDASPQRNLLEDTLNSKVCSFLETDNMVFIDVGN